MARLEDVLGADLVTTRLADRHVYSRDASLYRYLPEAIVRPRTINEVQALLRWCSENNRSCTFRTGGTSLSGQAVTDGIIVDLARHWSSVTIHDGGCFVTAQPGITGARVNALLAPHGRKIGPDPASLTAAMVGGIVANNASGMCCGTAQNSYNTVTAMKIVLANGYRIDTSTSNAAELLRTDVPEVYNGLISIRDQIRSDAALCDRIRGKYRIKNTMGYALNAFLDEDCPVQILRRLLVGSEGTLAFIEDVTFETIPTASDVWTALFVYTTIDDACAHVPQWTAAGAAAVEIMDDACLRSFAELPSTPDHLRIRTPGAAALLVEFQNTKPTIEGPWVTNATERATLWHLRKGLMPTVGAARAPGTTMINEDVAVPPDRLADVVKDVRRLLNDFGYTDGVIFGHAKDGNIHFVVNQRFSTEEDLERYASFMDAIAHVVATIHGGSLKAEHGTGRNMAPFVELEWGSTAYNIMWQVKQIMDPQNILNRGVLLNRSATVHLENIKPLPELRSATGERIHADLCIECGFCEHVCPTSTYTLSPRQRIVLMREMSLSGESLEQVFLEEAVGTCATDGLCALRCPVGIDTGTLMAEYRSQSNGPMARFAASILAKNISLSRRAAVLGTRLLPGLSPGKRPRTHASNHPEILLFPTCPSVIMAGGSAQRQFWDVVQDLCNRAGMRYTVMDSSNHCCGQPWSSKGFPDVARRVSEETCNAIASVAKQHDTPVFIDTSTCAAAVKERLSARGVRVLDQAEFCSMLIDRLTITNQVASVIVHPGCGTEKLGTTDVLMQIVRRCARVVRVPVNAACCGMAGDGGLRDPERVRRATEREIAEFPADATVGVTCNVACEHALATHSQLPFASLVHLLDAATR